jgi:hypothetical protein
VSRWQEASRGGSPWAEAAVLEVALGQFHELLLNFAQVGSQGRLAFLSGFQLNL